MIIDNEFRSLIPPLTDEEYEGLKASILAEGCRDALVLWGDTLIDGHNRYQICTEYGIPYRTVQKDFADRDEAMLWMMQNQLSRRNLHSFVRIELVERMKPLVAKKAKEQQARTAENRVLQISAEQAKERQYLGLKSDEGGRTDLLSKLTKGVVKFPQVKSR